ncbi:hypothetical protein DOTSEDRAFT_55082 [Dothistroma septosporum NZE10]|uniref:BTB domain-containing protein n=1 Tax=Dothistroma septosporum (strain NZE10 / CBS 128990) TaxID=675120 RepID=N1PGF5_DOTSN|nr:hypothetical protein DOTSEDRAFT_55082 [Dothistroma septosporum NZE10]
MKPHFPSFPRFLNSLASSMHGLRRHQLNTMADTNTTEMITIARDGDLLLAVGNGGKTTLLVSSAVLVGGSKYFAALISPRFREGQETRSVAKPPTIRLEDDSARSIQDLCGLLHGEEMAELYAPATSERLLHLAVVVDKYDCVSRLRPHTSAMLFTFLDVHQQQELDNKYLDHILAAAYLFDHSICFKIISKRLMLETITSRAHWPGEIPEDVLPERILDAIDHKRLIATVKANYELPRILLDFCPVAADQCLSDGREDYDNCFGRDRVPLQEMIENAKHMSQWRACEHLQSTDGLYKFEQLDTMAEAHRSSWPRTVLKTMMPGRMDEAIRYKRLIARDIIFTQLPAIVRIFCEEHESCDNTSRLAMNEAFHIAEDEEWPMVDPFTVETAIERMQQLTHTRRCKHNARNGAEDALDAMEDLISDVKKAARGLCLGCVRAAEVSTKDCTIKIHR